MRIDRLDRHAEVVRLLEVVPHDLLELAQPIPGRALEPVREALVQVGAGDLRQRPVRGVADQRMPEPVRLLAREVRKIGPDHITANERHQDAIESRLEQDGGELAHRTTMEDRPLDRGRGDDGPLVGRQAVEAGGEQSIDRRGNRNVGEVGRRNPRVLLPG